MTKTKRIVQRERNRAPQNAGKNDTSATARRRMIRTAETDWRNASALPQKRAAFNKLISLGFGVKQ